MKCFMSETTDSYVARYASGVWLRSSCPEVSYKKDALRNFAKFTGKHLCQVSFLIKLQASLRPGKTNLVTASVAFKQRS